MSVYSFSYSVIASADITLTSAYGGYYGSGNDSTVGGNATPGTDPSTEWGNLSAFRNTFPGVLGGTATAYVGGSLTVNPYPAWYTIAGNQSGVITFDTALPTDTFYIYGSGDLHLENITFVLSRNAQSYNIYIISAGGIYLRWHNYGNFIGDFVSPVGNPVYIDGTVSAVNGTVGIEAYKMTVQRGCPKYPFTFSAIASILSPSNDATAQLNINGGKYGNLTYLVEPNVVATNATFINASECINEVTNIRYFVNEMSTFLQDYVMNDVTGLTADIHPISTNNWYTIKGTADTVTTLTFRPVTPYDVFYIVTIDQNMHLENVTFITNDMVSPSNVYIFCNKTLYLATTVYGNVITDYSICSKSGNSTIYGTASSATTSDGFMIFNNDAYSTSSLSIIFTTAPTPCFLKGTKILTDQWYVPVEELKVGDLVIVKGDIHNMHHVVQDSVMPILGIQVHVRKASPTTSPIVITKNAFGINRPFDDLYVSPNHGMVSRNGTLYPSKKFVNWTTVYQDPTIETLTYYHIELAGHHVVTANGVLAETYRKPVKKR
jgi:hypothetical protein